MIDGLPTRIVGVMPPGYDVHGQKVELWLPLTIDPHSPGGRGSHFLYLVGRLKSGTTIQQARVDLDRLLGSWQAQAKSSHAPDPKDHRFRIDNLQDDIVGNVKKSLWVLQGAVGFVLLIACANLANLLLARADSRRREFAVRAALGASRLGMLGQFVTEGIVISVLGGVLGVVPCRRRSESPAAGVPGQHPAIRGGHARLAGPHLHAGGRRRHRHRVRPRAAAARAGAGRRQRIERRRYSHNRRDCPRKDSQRAGDVGSRAGGCPGRRRRAAAQKLLGADASGRRLRPIAARDVRSRPPRCGVSGPAAEGGRLHQAHRAYRAHSGCAEARRQ